MYAELTGTFKIKKMNFTLLPVVLMTIFSLGKKGTDLLSAIKKGERDQIKIELFFICTILLVSFSLFFILT
jgi:hypothetical protein